MAAFVPDISNALKGFVMGAANIVPGVSGGTIALITGIFGRLVASLDSMASLSTWKMLLPGAGGRFPDRCKAFFKAIDGRFLLGVGAGMLVSIVSLAKLMQYVLDVWPVQTWAFFFGMILASAFFMLFFEVKGWKFSYILALVAGAALGLLVFTLSPASTTDDLWFIFVCGAIAVCTMILPGVSGSFVLLLLGKYEYIMEAVSTFNLPVLAVFSVGCVLGLAAFSKMLHWLLERFEQPTMLVLVGFILGSLIKVWPWSEAALSAAAASAGFPSEGDITVSVTAGSMLVPGLVWIAVGIISVAALELLSRRRSS